MNYAVVVFGMFDYSLCANFLKNMMSTGGVLFLETIYFYFPKYGGRCWFKGPIRTIDDKDSGHTAIIDEVKEMHGF